MDGDETWVGDMGSEWGGGEIAIHFKKLKKEDRGSETKQKGWMREWERWTLAHKYSHCEGFNCLNINFISQLLHKQIQICFTK